MENFNHLYHQDIADIQTEYKNIYFFNTVCIRGYLVQSTSNANKCILKTKPKVLLFSRGRYGIWKAKKVAN